MLRNSLKVMTTDGEFELTRPSEIRIYNQMKSRKMTEEQLFEEIRFGNTTTTLLRVLLLESLMRPRKLMYAIRRGAIAKQDYQDLLSMNVMIDYQGMQAIKAFKPMPVETFEGVIELTRPSEIRIYDQIDANEMTDEEFCEEIRFGNVTSKLMRVLLSKLIISPEKLSYVATSGVVNAQNYEEIFPLDIMRDDQVLSLLKGLNLPISTVEKLYLALPEKGGRIRASAIPFSVAISLAEYMHHQLMTNQVDPAAIPSYIVKLDNLYMKNILRYSRNSLRARQEPLRDSKETFLDSIDMERSRDSATMTMDELRASGKRVVEIQEEDIAPINANIRLIDGVIGVIDGINDVNVDIIDIDLKPLDAVTFPECEHIKRYIKFADDYGHYYKSLTDYLSGLKRELCDVIRSHMEQHDQDELQKAEHNLMLAKVTLKAAEDRLGLLTPVQSKESATAAVGSTHAKFKIFAPGDAKNSVDAEALAQARAAVDEAAHAHNRAAKKVVKLQAAGAEKSGLSNLYACFKKVSHDMDIADAFNALRDVTYKLPEARELKHKTEKAFVHFCDSQLEKIRKMHFVTKAQGLLGVKQGVAIERSPRLGKRSRNPSPVGSPVVSTAASHGTHLTVPTFRK